MKHLVLFVAVMAVTAGLTHVVLASIPAAIRAQDRALCARAAALPAGTQFAVVSARQIHCDQVLR